MVDNEVKKEFITIPEAIEEFGNSREWWSERLQDGRIKGKKNGEWKINRQSIVDYFSSEANSAKATANIDYQVKSDPKVITQLKKEAIEESEKRMAVNREEKLKAEKHIEDIEEFYKQKAEIAIWEIAKANEIAQIEATKSAQDKRESDFNQKETEIEDMQTHINTAWEEVRNIRASLDAPRLKKLAEEEAAKELVNRLAKGDYKTYNELMNNCLDVLHKYGEKKFVYRIEDELDAMWKLAQNNLQEHLGELEESMKAQVIEVNQKAVKMARLPKEYPPKSWNEIVDNLEIIWKLIPEIRPSDIPIDDEGITADMPNKNKDGGKTK